MEIFNFRLETETCSLGHFQKMQEFEKTLDFRLPDCVVIQKSTLFLPVMPVPDQVRDDGSGIQ